MCVSYSALKSRELAIIHSYPTTSTACSVGAAGPGCAYSTGVTILLHLYYFIQTLENPPLSV